MESQCILGPASKSTLGLPAAARADAWRRALATWWQAMQTRRARQRTATLLSELNEHLLHDIGAPPWALSESKTLRAMARNRRKYWLCAP
ncbi:hypothetical protein GG851_22330 [Bordetella petrii]|nr:hypothetical protein [Bordetella petrii]